MAQNYVGQRSGRVNADAATSSRALFLKLYAGEVMTAFQTKNIMMNYTRTRFTLIQKHYYRLYLSLIQ